MLVPYERLDDKEKVWTLFAVLRPPHCSRRCRLCFQESSRRNAAELVKAMIFFGYKFKLGAGHTAVDPSDLCSNDGEDVGSILQRK